MSSKSVPTIRQPKDIPQPGRLNLLQKLGQLATRAVVHTDAAVLDTIDHLKQRGGIIVTRTMLTTLAVAGVAGAIDLSAPSEAHAASNLEYKVDATTAAGGVFARYGPHVTDTQRINGYGVYPGQTVRLLCGVTNGDPVGLYHNTTWHYIVDESNHDEGNFWINDHYLDTPNKAGQLTPGESSCPGPSSDPITPTSLTIALSCAPVLLIGARGSGEYYVPDGSGITGFGPTLATLADQLAARYGSNLATYGLPYEAIEGSPDTDFYDNAKYISSVTDGVNKLTDILTTQAAVCPNQIIDLVGYSQGADVVNTAISTLPLSVQIHIGGVATFGDPLFNGQNLEDKGDYDPILDGAFAIVASPRAELPLYMISRTHSYCAVDDWICNFHLDTPFAGEGHMHYAETWVPDAVKFLEGIS